MKEQNLVSVTESNPTSPEAGSPIALVDMDGTLCNCAAAIAEGLANLRGPNEEPREEQNCDLSAHIIARRRLIMSVPGFWRSLQPLPLGFQIVALLRQIGFDIYVLTKGPSDQALAWTEKFEWCRDHVPDMSVIVTEDKSLVPGTVFVEDWPPYFNRWLQRHPRGFVVVPAQPWNLNAKESFPGRTIRYDGANLDAVRNALEALHGCRKSKRGQS